MLFLVGTNGAPSVSRYVDPKSTRTPHDQYVDAVRKAAANAMAKGFLLQADADALIAQAVASNVLK